MDNLVKMLRQLAKQSDASKVGVSVKAPARSLDGSIELLLQHIEPERAMQLRLCAIPHYFSSNILQALGPSLSASQAKMRCKEFC